MIIITLINHMEKVSKIEINSWDDILALAEDYPGYNDIMSRAHDCRTLKEAAELYAMYINKGGSWNTARVHEVPDSSPKSDDD